MPSPKETLDDLFLLRVLAAALGYVENDCAYVDAHQEWNVVVYPRDVMRAAWYHGVTTVTRLDGAQGYVCNVG